MNTAGERKMASPQQNTVCVVWYWETKLVIQVQRSYCLEYRQAPGGQFIKRWLVQLKEAGSVQHCKWTDRPSVDADTVESVYEAFQRSQRKSTHHTSRELQIPHSPVQKLVHSWLELHAYKIQVVQAL
jgi:hypothetical protein